ncbi:TrbC family F-type conjugative pilus assembly protein [Pseudomonas aeruginosa]|uniref:TrbC family F-type conjugative pilus assembly protein n=1 Tax=Pseudomonas aeruginosa TaxID=287 RepID=UPI000B5A698B|nr:TrbC family F-type conjugative pilus assembly protein [Pseudomonas aeruginosa]ASJ88538.1 conjugal transfer pilus assembly protein TraW [Pseudomonas aeruginosa]
MVIRAVSLAASLMFAAQAVSGPLGIDPNPQISKEDMDLIESIRLDSQQAYQRGLTENTFDWAKEDEEAAAKAALAPEEKVEGSKVERLEMKPGETYVIYVSWSLGESFIKGLMKENKDSGNVVLKFRGIPEGLTMVQSLAKIQRLSMDTKSPVSVEIDPVSFADNGVQLVPFIAKYRDGEVVSVAKGSADTEIFRSKPGVADLGVVGDQVEIAEKDLIELMKERASKLDFNEMKRRAIGRFWANQNFIELGQAQEDRTRKLDPTIVVPADMRAADGTLIHAEGTRINPLDIRPFNQRLVIIDPSQEWQLSLARDQIDRFGKGQLVTIILTSVEVETGWGQLKSIEDRLDQPAYILTPEVKERFDLEFTPSVVTADASTFLIQEFSGSNAK